MTSKTKAAIEEDAINTFPKCSTIGKLPIRTNYYARIGFTAGAKEVIEHPEKYGLFTREQVLEIIRKGFSNE